MTNLQLLSALRAVRATLASPQQWTKDAFARDATGKVCEFLSPKAVCWCLEGALYNACLTHEQFWTVYTLLVDLITPPELALSDWQDKPERTHADILALLDRAESTLTEVNAND